MKPYRQAHRPGRPWEWYVGLALEAGTMLLMIVVVVLLAGLAR